jgi:predicted SAM-dependent methyltransferase
MDLKQTYLKVKDHSVSYEEFNLLYNPTLDLLETSPKPSKEKLQDYYKSEDYISHTDGKRNLFEKAYQWIKSISLKRKLELIDSFNFEEKQLLDVGCGTGDFLHKAINTWDVVGIEPNERAREIANKKTVDKVYDVDSLPKLKASSCSIITLWHVLEHLPELEYHISLFEKILKDNGRLIIAVPNYKSFDANYYKSYWAAYDVPRHLWHFSQSAIKSVFSKNGFEIETVHPMKFDAYYVSLLSEKYKSGWMNFFSAFFIATRSNLKAARTGEYSSLIYVLKKS